MKRPAGPASLPVAPRIARRRALQRIAAAAVRVDAWDIPLIGPADRSDYLMVRRDRYDALAAACIAYLEIDE